MTVPTLGPLPRSVARVAARPAPDPPPASRTPSPLIPAARRMRGDGMTLRGIAAALGVSYQRVHQWLRPVAPGRQGRRSDRTLAILDRLAAAPADRRDWFAAGRFETRPGVTSWLRTHRPRLPGWRFCGRQDGAEFVLYARRVGPAAA